MMRSTSPRVLNQKSPKTPRASIKSPVSLNKSTKKTSKSLSPGSKPHIKQASHQQILQKMKKNRQRLCSTLDTFTLLIRSNNPIRCLQHNSNISIYCETQQKLLCSNCIFAKLDHKYHKVVPVDKVHGKLTRDVEIMQRQIERQVQGIQEAYRRVFDHYEQEQKSAQEGLIKVQQFFQDARIMIDECEIESKRRIMRQLQDVQVKHETVLAELSFLKNVYKDQYVQVPPINDANFLLYEHVMCHTVISQCKFSYIKWKKLIHQIQKTSSQECKKITKVLDILDSYLRQRLKDR